MTEKIVIGSASKPVSDKDSVPVYLYGIDRKYGFVSEKNTPPVYAKFFTISRGEMTKPWVLGILQKTSPDFGNICC